LTDLDACHRHLPGGSARAASAVRHGVGGRVLPREGRVDVAGDGDAWGEVAVANVRGRGARVGVLRTALQPLGGRAVEHQHLRRVSTIVTERVTGEVIVLPDGSVVL
jgi:hypothetical protein